MPDATVLPSSPGRPNLLNISDDGIVELEWTAPERQGASSIVGYIMQYWSPEMGEVCVFFFIWKVFLWGFSWYFWGEGIF